MELSYPVFMVLFSLILIVAMAAGLYIFGDFGNLTRSRIKKGIEENWIFAITLALILLAIVVENKTHDFMVTLFPADHTHLIFTLSFKGAIVKYVQDTLRSGIADWFFIIIYLFSYTFVLFFTPLLYMVRNDKKRMKQYTLAMVVNYAILIPFYVMFAVRTPGYYGLSSVDPILYSHPNFLQMVLEVDPLDNCFPSGHVSVPVTAFLLLSPLCKHKQYLRFAVFMGTLSILICISVLYLGIHWSVDIVAGLLLALFAVWIAKNKRIMNWFDERMPPLVNKILPRKLTIKEKI